MSEEQFSIDAAEAKGRALPQWYLDAPIMEWGDEWFFDAFWALSTCRRLGFGVVGPIPVTAIWTYCDRAGLDTQSARTLEYAVAQLDVEYLSRTNKQPKAKAKAKTKKPAPKAVSRARRR